MVSYKIGGQHGQQINLKEANDLVAVRMKEGHKLPTPVLSSTQRSLSPQIVLVASFPEANVNVYRCIGRGGRSDKQARNMIRRGLRNHDNVQFAGRTLIDDKGIIHLYTENAFIKFKDHIPIEVCKQFLAENELSVKKKVKYAPNSFFVKAPEGLGLGVFPIINELLKNDEVEFAHPEIIRQKKKKNTSSIFEKQWHLKESNLYGQVINAHVDAENAWNITKGKGITIAIIDDGVDIDHPEFNTKGKIRSPKNMFPESDNPRPNPISDPHGTACAGVACANGKNQAAGVAPEANLMPIRLNTNLGSMYEAEAIVHAADNGADIISCSWGPQDGDWANPNDILHSTYVALPDSTRLAIEYALKHGRKGKGCCIVWAAGNGRESVSYDGYANHPEIICVAASNDSNTRSVYSDFGKNVWCCFPSSDRGARELNHPSPKTPGIWTTDNLGKGGYNPEIPGIALPDESADYDYTAKFGGTSSSTPGVAGVIALILSVNPELTYQEVKEIIKNSCEKIDSEYADYDEDGHSLFYGYGKINAWMAVNNAVVSKEWLS